jgi:hypothetical protein
MIMNTSLPGDIVINDEKLPRPTSFVLHKIQELEYFVRTYFIIKHGSTDDFKQDAIETLGSLEIIIKIYSQAAPYSRTLALIDEFFDTAIMAFKHSCYDSNRVILDERIGRLGNQKYRYSKDSDETFIGFFFNIISDIAKELTELINSRRMDDELDHHSLAINPDMCKVIGARIVSYHSSRHEEIIAEFVYFSNEKLESNLSKMSSEFKANAKAEIENFLSILMKNKSEELSNIKIDYKKFNDFYEGELEEIIAKTHENDAFSKEVISKANSLLESAKDIHGKTNREAMAGTFEKISKELIAPLCLWSIGLVLSLAAIFSVGIYFYLYGTIDLTIPQLLSRVFLITPMVWLAWFSGRQYNHTSKLRQDYRYKSAVARAYHGYKAETGEEHDQMHAHLLKNIIDHFSDNPVRLYDKVESAMPIEEFLKKISPEHIVDIWKTAVQVQAKDDKSLKEKQN